MLPGHLVDKYLKTYREYIMREAEKSRKLKILDQIKTKNPEITKGTSASFPIVGFRDKILHRVSLWRNQYSQRAQPLRLLEDFFSLFRPDPPCETC